MIDNYLNEYEKSTSHNINLDKYKLSHNLLSALKESNNDFPYIKALLLLAYNKNRKLERGKSKMEPLYYLISKFSNFKLIPSDEERTSLDRKEIIKILARKPFIIPTELKDNNGKKLSQNLHRVIQHLDARVKEYENLYTARNKEYLLGHIRQTAESEQRNPIDIIGAYAGLSFNK